MIYYGEHNNNKIVHCKSSSTINCYLIPLNTLYNINKVRYEISHRKTKIEVATFVQNT